MFGTSKRGGMITKFDNKDTRCAKLKMRLQVLWRIIPLYSTNLDVVDNFVHVIGKKK